MERRRPGSIAEGGSRVALQAQHVHVAEFQHVRIWRTVSHMARGAALRLYGCVLKDKWAVLVHVALKADRILAGGSSHLFGSHSSVGIVAIGALDQAFVHAVVERHGKLRLLLEMAGVAKLRLRLH